MIALTSGRTLERIRRYVSMCRDCLSLEESAAVTIQLNAGRTLQQNCKERYVIQIPALVLDYD